MDENQFWSRVWMSIAVLIGIAIVTIGGCTAYETSLVAEAVKAGADPIDARCGVGGPSSSITICTVRAAR